MFYVILFALLAGLLVFAGATAWMRVRSGSTSPGSGDGGHHADDAQRRQRKAKRAQSRQARRKRH
jgi:hypothetical protein